MSTKLEVLRMILEMALKDDAPSAPPQVQHPKGYPPIGHYGMTPDGRQEIGDAIDGLDTFEAGSDITDHARSGLTRILAADDLLEEILQLFMQVVVETPEGAKARQSIRDRRDVIFRLWEMKAKSPALHHLVNQQRVIDCLCEQIGEHRKLPKGWTTNASIYAEAMAAVRAADVKHIREISGVDLDENEPVIKVS